MNNNNHENYSFLDPIVNSNPFEFYKLLHKEQPVYQIPEIGMFMITKYDDIRFALKAVSYTHLTLPTTRYV